MSLEEVYKDRVLELFFRTELREGENVIDNLEETIAKELNIKVGVVKRILFNEMTRRELKLKNK